MFCTKCGGELPAGATHCPSCGAPPASLLPSSSSADRANWSKGAKPNSYLIFAILTTIFCCWPFGVVALVYAAQVDAKYYQGDTNAASRFSKNALIWSWLSFGSILLVLAFYLILVLFGFLVDV